ncbi:flippase [Vibrio fluvialis]|uniref:flippase n=1 Tax=Vibrio fluvialis TaxID=676 RepID=UPI001559C018|nr:flippase [Vibrio fluvialis]EKO3409701.1 flippase [Vibrio fluvialis]ELP2653598.1 flippase [Vibrio fluvialis]MBY8035681.1 flippase [Vibrio fluvialis]MBY8039691.1 flippase [Vibrio fluvialis]MBY8194709.1 flippase [Vibrio fluvialis]
MKEKIINLFWLCLEQGGRILSSFLITVLIVKHLGVEQFGSFSLALAILTTLGPLVGLGFDSILFKKFISKEDDTTSLLQVSCFLRLVVAALVIIVCTVINFVSSEPYLYVLNILVLGFIFDSFLAFKDYFLANLKNKFYTYSTLVSSVIQLVIVFLLVNDNASIGYFAWSYVIAKAIQSIVLFGAFYKVQGLVISPRWKKSLSLNLLKASYPMMFAASIGLLYSLQDQYFIKYFLGEYELGLYAVGIKFVLILVVLPTLISNVFYPSLVSKYHAGKYVEYNNQLQAMYLLFFILGLILYSFLYFSSEMIVIKLFGDEFKDSVLIMQIYSLLLVVSFFQSLNNKVLILNDLQSVIFKRATFALIINAVLNFIMIPKFGIKGAAYSTVMSEILVLISYSFRKDTRFIFYHQIKAIFFLNILKKDVMRSIKS